MRKEKKKEKDAVGFKSYAYSRGLKSKKYPPLTVREKGKKFERTKRIMKSEERKEVSVRERKRDGERGGRTEEGGER